MFPWSIFEKFSLLFLRFSPEFRCSNILAVTEYTGNQIFLASYQNCYFFKMFTLVLLDECLDGFSKFRFFVVEIYYLIWYFWVIFDDYSMRNWACWAYVETILSHTEHTPKEISRMLCSASVQISKVVYLVRIEYDCQNSRVTGPWDHKVLVSAKKSKNEFHACVPLN